MTPFVVDANVMNLFQQERYSAEFGIAHEALEAILASSFVALDADGQCEAEWLSCAKGKPPLDLQDWIADMYVQEKLRLFPYTCDSMFRELSGLGIPKKDHKWVRLARSSSSDVIVTNDIDLFDPSRKKDCNSKIKDRIKENRSGPVCKYLRKNHRIEIICPVHVRDHIGNQSA